MQIIIDTHVLIWWWADDPRLPVHLREMLATPEIRVYVSAVSALEMAIKVRTGRLPEMAQRIGQFHEGVRDNGFVHLNMHYEHAVRAGLLPGDHRDPFDRLLAAQALVEDLPIMTRDPEFAGFGCKVLW